MSSLHKLKATLRIVVVVIVMGSLVGCGGRLGDFTLLTSKQFNVPINSMEKGARVTGEDCATQILFIPIGHIHPSVKTAIDQAIEKESANALVDVVVEESVMWALLFANHCITVTGTAATIK
jgi:hypothetical protein